MKNDQFFINSEHILDVGQKNEIEFSPDFSPFFTARPTSEHYDGPLKVIIEGSFFLPAAQRLSLRMV